MNHIAVMDKLTIDMILSGKKTIESRFSKKKITPYQKVKENEIVYLKETGGKIIGLFIIEKVLFFNLSEVKIQELKKKYNKYILAPNSYWDIKKDANYGTLMYIKNPKRIGSITIQKKNRLAFLETNINY